MVNRYNCSYGDALHQPVRVLLVRSALAYLYLYRVNPDTKNANAIKGARKPGSAGGQQ